ncbi:hypothetical protein DKT69_04885 [Micromonospora sicca]|nr:hypothetical protein [Micromonospora sp. 4G51]PWR16598.1 hypothetical protein DKT69_04885 [Micromonospora sp. 4G51]
MCGHPCLRHPVIGELHLTFEVLELGADDGLSVVAYGTEPGTASEDGLRLLANWSATQNQDAGTDAINSPGNRRSVNGRLPRESPIT